MMWKLLIILISAMLMMNKLADCKDVTKNAEKAFGQNCDVEYSATCIKLDIVTFIEKLSERKEYSLFPGISLVRELNASDPKTAEIISDISRSFPNDADKRLDGYIIARLSSFLQSLSLRLKLMESSTGENASTARRGGHHSHHRKGIEALLAAGMMMKGTLMTVAMGALAALAGKALMTGLMALMLSGIVGLKSMTSGGHKSTTYEIVAKPVHQMSHSHSVSHEDIHGGGGHGHSGYGSYGRSLNIVLPEHLKNTKTK